jgi:hypothetical protein
MNKKRHFYKWKKGKQIKTWHIEGKICIVNIHFTMPRYKFCGIKYEK